MTRAPRYRFEAAETLKQSRRADAEHALARGQRELTQATATLEQSRHALAEHLRGAPAEPAQPARALDLQRAAAFATRHAEVARTLRGHVGQAEAELARRKTQLEQLQHALGGAHAEQQLIERDRQRFEQAQRRELEQAEQLEREDHALGHPRAPKR